MSSRRPFGAFVRVDPFSRCDFEAYHGTYAARMVKILREGIELGRGGGVWLTRDPRWAWEHAAWKAAKDGCERAPVAVVRVRVVGDERSCPVYRPIHPRGVPDLFYTTERVPAGRVLGIEPVNVRALERGIERGRATRGKKRPRRVCPPRP